MKNETYTDLEQKTQPLIPQDATEVEVFYVTGAEAYIGYKLKGSFHFVQVPFTVPKPILINRLKRLIDG